MDSYQLAGISLVTGVTVVGAAAVCGAVRRRLRYRPCKVNCWFCCTDNLVTYDQQNGWTCYSCGQYNGFTSDGDYNRDIPEQRTGLDVTNHGGVRYAVPSSPHGAKKAANNGFCSSCNLNQELKIHHLRHFVPVNEGCYDEELADYQAQLEQTYRLCRYCEAKLHQTLGEQDSWIKPKFLAWKLEKSRQTPLSTAHKLAFPDDNANVGVQQRAIVLILALMMFCQEAYLCFGRQWSIPLEIHYELHYLSAFYHQSVAVSVFIVMAFYVLQPWPVLYLTRHQICMGTWVMAFLSSILEQYLFAAYWHQSPDQLVSRFLPAAAVAATSIFAMTTGVRVQEKPSKKIMTPTALLRQPAVLIDDTLTEDLLSECASSFDWGSGGGAKSDDWLRPKTTTDSCDLSLLHIGKSRSPVVPGKPSTFSLKTYQHGRHDTSFGEAFLMPGLATRPSVLKPPKFVYEQRNRVAQSSWVAGGYWRQTNGSKLNSSMDQADCFSRASSLTSGFVSVSNCNAGSLPNSRCDSVYGDQQSVLSEPVFRHELNLSSCEQPHYSTFNASPMSMRHQGDSDNISIDSSIDRLTQKAFSVFKPKAQSSPLEAAAPVTKVCNGTTASCLSRIMEKSIQIRVSVYSVLLVSSLLLNIGVILAIFLS